MFETLFSERGLSLERLRTLVEVHDAGSIVQTSPEKASRNSLYSRQLGELSQFFGCEVVQRRGKVLKLTTTGVRLVEMVRPFLRGLSDFHSGCRKGRAMFNIAAGDSLIHWLAIPRIGGLVARFPDVQFTMASLRTNEIVQQMLDERVDFGLIRKNAISPGLKSVVLGTLAYVAVVPTALTLRKPSTFSEALSKYPHAMQVTDGQFTKQLLDTALSETNNFQAALGCESFPQILAAVRSNKFAAIVPELAAQDLPSKSVHIITGGALKNFQRDIVLAWNPRVVRVRPHAQKLLAQLGSLLKF